MFSMVLTCERFIKINLASKNLSVKLILSAGNKSADSGEKNAIEQSKKTNTMKISNQDYAKMKADISAVAKARNVDFTNGGEYDAKVFSPRIMFDLLAFASHNRAFDDAHPQYVSNPAFRVLPFTGQDYCWYYKSGLNDTHIETALRKIQTEIA